MDKKTIQKIEEIFIRKLIEKTGIILSVKEAEKLNEIILNFSNFQREKMLQILLIYSKEGKVKNLFGLIEGIFRNLKDEVEYKPLPNEIPLEIKPDDLETEEQKQAREDAFKYWR